MPFWGNLFSGAKVIATGAPFLIVGLGNPGAQYEGTRHNVGFVALDYLSSDFGVLPKSEKKAFKGLVSEGAWQGHKVLFLKPLTYMNLSGESVQLCAHYYKIPLSRILVIHDDLDLVPGDVRFKVGGSDAGHNGLKSISQHMGKDYARLRIGIGHPGHKDRVTPYVLGPFSKQDQPLMEEALSKTYAFVENWLEGALKNTTTNGQG